MRGFELIDRDGLARIGRLDTPHGVVETPALLPVVHPSLERQPIAPQEMRARFGVRAVITSAYIAWRDPTLRVRAEQEGIHRLIEFDGPIMTDSGAFQQHAYGSVEIEPSVAMAFQARIGSDIATVLDRFIEPEAPPTVAKAGVEETVRRSEEARTTFDGLLAVPVQGGMDPDLRRRSAEAASRLGDIAAVGGVVPLMERYRYGDLVRVLHSVRPGLAPGRPVHLFGTGHPMLFALAALFGVDLFDSSAYHKFARREDLLFPSGTIALARVKEPFCSCRLCDADPLDQLRSKPAAERERAISRHNLLMSLEEVSRVRQAIRDGLLWELVEQRAHGHPALLAALEPLLAQPTTFLATEPVSRPSFRAHGVESLERPSVVAFDQSLERFQAPPGPTLTGDRPPLLPTFLARIPPRTPEGTELHWNCPTPFGPVPLELSELYPVGPAVVPSDFGPRTPSRLPAGTDGPRVESTDLEAEWTAVWTRRHMAAVLRWSYGPAAAGLVDQGLVGHRSRRTGRLRILSAEGVPAFTLGNDGIPRPGWRGAEMLHDALPFPLGRVGVESDAVEFVAAGRSLFAPFARPADPSLRPGASALLVDTNDRLLAVGRLLLAPHEFASFRRGVAARVTSHAHLPASAADIDEEMEPSDGTD